MTKLEEIEKAITGLRPEDMAEFRRWYEEFDAKVWDEQIERDAKAGKLDELAQQAVEDHQAGRTKEL